MERAQLTAPATGSVTRVRCANLAGLMLDQQRKTTQLLAQPMFSIGEVAASLGVNPNTVRQWLKKGLVAGYRSGVRGHFRIPGSELAKLKGV